MSILEEHEFVGSDSVLLFLDPLLSGTGIVAGLLMEKDREKVLLFL